MQILVIFVSSLNTLCCLHLFIMSVTRCYLPSKNARIETLVLSGLVNKLRLLAVVMTELGLEDIYVILRQSSVMHETVRVILF